MQIADLNTNAENQWCPGCPNFGILTALKRAVIQLDIDPARLCLVSGIGQAAKLPHYLRSHVFNGLHGRAIPAAIGIHVARPEMTTIVTSGDGDLYGEGGNHLLHALRRNPNLTVMVHNNQLYALTKGQGSPTTPRGETTRLQFEGMPLAPIDFLAIAIAHNCGFVARGYARDLDRLTQLMVGAIEHRGLSLLEIVQPCITWSRHPMSWYDERVQPVPEDHDPTDQGRAIELAREAPDRLRSGILYQRPPRELFGAAFREQTGERPLAELPAVGHGAIEDRIAARFVDVDRSAA
jgi:2-oxoglutarate ferredoxin oxidoreductase subunit beta